MRVSRMGGVGGGLGAVLGVCECCVGWVFRLDEDVLDRGLCDIALSFFRKCPSTNSIAHMSHSRLTSYPSRPTFLTPSHTLPHSPLLPSHLNRPQIPKNTGTLTHANPRYTLAPTLQFGASLAGKAASGSAALSTYASPVPVANSTVRTCGSCCKCDDAHEQSSIRDTAPR